MPGVFDSDIFTMVSLTAAINDVEYLPNQIGSLGLFEPAGVSTTSVLIEKDGEKLGLVENKSRGAPGTVIGGDKRSGFTFTTAHLPTTATVLADEVQNVREFGSEDSMKAVQSVVNRRLAKMARFIDITHEYHRIGAMQGKVLDSDGTTVIYDLYQVFGITEKSVVMALATAGTDMQGKCLDILEKIEEGLGGLSFTGATAMCGKSFWRKFISHSKVKEAYERYQNGERLRADPRDAFYFGGIYWERYRGGGKVKIPDDQARVVPLGVMDLFISRFAPAPYGSTVNTLGLPFYASSDMLPHDKGVELEAQSNPAHLCTRPQACIKLTE
ncbi:major capsid protein (plasmid) [Halomonas qaidamensis]|uniref:Major capsid protein n=1 Tax=Halomonas qaidamensis TaxID=2866211 RepID=A0ABY6JVN6_9GAMM|nr:major capsid protein [Halomonas qaidamensis]UYV20920.1 major capsid protein [Halomonas qaidamensis]